MYVTKKPITDFSRSHNLRNYRLHPLINNFDHVEILLIIYWSQYFGEIRLGSSFRPVMRRSNKRKNEIRRLLVAPTNKRFWKVLTLSITDRERVTPTGQPEPGFPAIGCNCWLYFILHESIYYSLLQLFLLNWFDHQKKTSSYYLDMAIFWVTDQFLCLRSIGFCLFKGFYTSL